VFDVVIEFPKMKVGVATREDRVAEIRYLPLSSQNISARNPLAERAARQLERYREDPDTKFDLPLAIEGTAFQRRLWDALCEIPRGKTLTYGELARRLGGDRFSVQGAEAWEMSRAVGQACGDNRLPIVIPCHRVVAANGIGGFAHATDGYLLEAKRWLLMHERGVDAFELTP
jgi:methylated-DNA-[protein]-cysteine S-methyltransferase